MLRDGGTDTCRRMWKRGKPFFFCFAFIPLSIGWITYAFPEDTPIGYEMRQGMENDAFARFYQERCKLPETEEEVSLLAVGDIMLSRYVARKIDAKDDIHYPFINVRNYLKQADIVFGNLESPITAGRKIGSGEMIFRANPGMEQALKEVGFNVLSLANNHVPNFGDRGIRETLAYLDTAGIKHTGAGWDDADAYAPVFLEIKGFTFAFLAYNDTDVVPPVYEATPVHGGTAFMNIARMVTAIREAKRHADFVVVSMHSGHEYTAKANHSQSFFAHTAIDNGADLVIGHHPHVVQPIETYQGKFICYSLGNFIFDQSRSGTREGLMAEFIFDRVGIVRIGLIPVIIEEYCRPRIVSEEQVPNLFKRLMFPLEDQQLFSWHKETGKVSQTNWKLISIRQSRRGNMTRTLCADLDRDGIMEDYSLYKGHLKVVQGSKKIWESLWNWWIDDFVLEDSTNDGEVNLNLSIWKAPSFDATKTAYFPEESLTVNNHFCVYAVRHGKLESLWTSPLPEAPNLAFAVADVDDDNQNELITLEGSYLDETASCGERVSLWQWNGQQFINEWRSPQGEYSGLRVSCIDGMATVVVDCTCQNFILVNLLSTKRFVRETSIKQLCGAFTAPG